MSGLATIAPDSARKLSCGWRWVKLGDISEVISKGTTPTSLGHAYVHEGIAFLRAEDISGSAVNPATVAFRITVETDALLARSRLLSGDFLVTIAGTLGRVGYVPEDAPPMNCNQAVAFARLDKARVDVRFLTLVCQHHDVISALLELKAGGALQNLNLQQVQNWNVPLPPLPEQKRIAGILIEQMAAVEKARQAAEEQANAAESYPFALVRDSLKSARSQRMPLGDCLDEVRAGVGAGWAKYPVLGATRQGLALAKDPVGKTPERYKPVTCGTVFYNPMRILLGSIAMVDESDAPGITSPDYVVVRGKDGILDSRWFYYWFRSPFGAHLIESLSRGAVRERILFNRLAEGMIELPPLDVQKAASDKMRHIAGTRRTVYGEIETINRLPAALLRRAFNGDL